ncbi:MAG: precorrin-8X methylmutase [Candidatus Hodgkinia cicadicola]
MHCLYWAASTRALALRLCYCSGFNAFKYCVYTDGFFKRLLAAISKNSLVIADTNALSCMLSSLAASIHVKVCSIISSSRVTNLARHLQCTRSCVQLDAWASLLPYIKRRNLVFVIATSPTSLLRLLELTNAHAIDPSAVIACPVGLINCNVSKRKLCLSKLNAPFLTIRGKIGGVAFGATILNSLKHS